MAEPAAREAEGDPRVADMEDGDLEEQIQEDEGTAYADEFSLEDQFDGMQLHGEEEEDLDLTEELEGLVQEVRWLGIFRVHTTKSFSHVALFKQMRNAWASAKDVTFKTLGVNLFLVQCQCLGDWNRIMDGGPWIFRGAAIVVEEYDGYTNVLEYKLEKIPVWARINGVPGGLDEEERIGRKSGKECWRSAVHSCGKGRKNQSFEVFAGSCFY